MRLNPKHIFAVGLMMGGAMGLHAQSSLELMEQARNAYHNYEFSEATRLLNAAKGKLPKDDPQLAEWQSRMSHQVKMAKNFLERVEDIVVIGTTTVDRDNFFKAYRIPTSAGYLEGADALPYEENYVDYVFTNEADNYKLWASPDSTGHFQIVESSLLTDGNWSEPMPMLHTEGDAIYPFMMADGVTLYYADNGPNSIGGYDIMVATRDATTGKFLQPSNLGFPYNSPANDYLMAIDEENGIGWWATDRDAEEDELTIYYFVTNDLRRNYDADLPNIVALAHLNDYEASWPEDADLTNYLDIIERIEPGVRSEKAEFTLRAPDGKTYTSYSQLPNAEVRTRTKQYFAALANLEQSESELRDLRMKYHSSPTGSLTRSISKAEKEIERERENVKKLKNEMMRQFSSAR